MKTRPFIDDDYGYRVPKRRAGVFAALAIALILGVIAAIVFELGRTSAMPSRVKAYFASAPAPIEASKRAAREAVRPLERAPALVQRAPAASTESAQRDVSALAATPEHATQTSRMTPARARVLAGTRAAKRASQSERDEATAF